MTSAFESLTGPGKPLRAEPPDSKEFAGLQRMGLARLKDAQHQGLSLESQFDLAYNAAHALCLADSDNLPAPEVIAQEIVEDLQAALEQFKLIAWDLDLKQR